MKTHILRMLPSMEWADRKVVATLREAPSVPAEALRLLSHLVIHGGYHRGQIGKVLGQAGLPATNTDYITIVRQVG